MFNRILVCVFFLITVFSCSKGNSSNPLEVNPIETTQNKDFSLAKIFQTGMVIQRDKPAKIWGYAKAANVVSVTTSWHKKAITVTTSANGEWVAEIPATGANEKPQTITVSTSEQADIVINDVLIGDVWICSGQSNMVMPVGPLAPSFIGVEDFANEISIANLPKIRSLTIKTDYQQQPLSEFTSVNNWVICSPETVGALGATAYFFAKKIHQEIDVPIGIIISAVNGTWCENWMNKEAFDSDATIQRYANSGRSLVLYNGMIAPLSKLSIKGFTWYQGENDQNISPVSNYTNLNVALINGWRAKFNQGNLPFYYVQLTPFDSGNTGNPTLNHLAKFREAQMNIRNNVADVGMAVTMDVGEVNNHHPRYKKEVGNRLALLALDNIYNKNIQSVGPQYLSFSQKGNNITINFVKGTAKDLRTKNNTPLNQTFFVATNDRVFKQVTANIDGNKIILNIPPDIQSPVVAIRYAFTNYPITNLENSSNLPMEPFRTDNW